MIVENTEAFQVWLTTILKPLSDADSATLARYVLALMKKDKSESELRRSMLDQLDVFLQLETKSFVDKLFEVLKSKEYLNVKLDENEASSKSGTSGSESESQSSSKGEESLIEEEDGKKVVKKTDTSSSSSADSSQEDSSTERRNRRSTGSNDDRHGGNRRKRLRLDRDFDRRVSRIQSPGRITRNRQRDRIMRHQARNSPPMPRRYERAPRDRRWSRSPIRNRSVSPRDRRSFYTNRGGSRFMRGPSSRSPLNRNRRSRSLSSPNNNNRNQGKVLLNIDPAELRLSSSSPEKHSVQSVVVKPNSNFIDQSSTTAAGADSQQYQQQQGLTSFGGQGQQEGGGNRCRDFDEKGLCYRGELCPFDHGHDSIVLEGGVVPLFGMTRGDVMPPSSGAPPFASGEYYPENPVMEQPVPSSWGAAGGPPQHFRPRNLNFDQMPSRGRGGSGMLLRPPGPGFSRFPPGVDRQLINVPVALASGDVPSSSAGIRMIPGAEHYSHPSMAPAGANAILHHHRPHSYPRNGGMGRGQGRGRGGGYDRSRHVAAMNTAPHNYYGGIDNCSLEVRKIPREQNTIMDLNSHFLRFGKIINIQISFDQDPEAALVTFSSPAEAQLAHKSTEAVLNNRFIKVFWHSKDKDGAEGSAAKRISVKDRLGSQAQPQQPKYEDQQHNQHHEGAPTIASAAAAVAARKAEEDEIRRNQEMLAAEVTNYKKAQEQKKQETMKAQEQKKQETIRKMSNDLRKRQQVMIEEMILQQKKLIAKIENGNLTKEEKEETYKLIKLFQGKVEMIKKDLDETNAVLVVKKKVVEEVEEKAAPVTPVFIPVPADTHQSKQKAEREMLDAEMDLYNTELKGESTNELEMKVMELRNRAMSLGLLQQMSSGSSSRGGYRGGRGGRGFLHGRRIMRGRM